jgi:hypothetical protein
VSVHCQKVVDLDTIENFSGNAQLPLHVTSDPNEASVFLSGFATIYNSVLD